MSLLTLSLDIVSPGVRTGRMLESKLLLTPFQTNGIVHKATYNKIRMVHCLYIEGLQVIISKKYCISFSEDLFCLKS